MVMIILSTCIFIVFVLKVESFIGNLVMGQFHHDNVVTLYGVISRVDPVMIVMEFLQNGSLDRYLQVLIM